MFTAASCQGPEQFKAVHVPDGSPTLGTVRFSRTESIAVAVRQAGSQPRTHPFAQALRRAIEIRGVTLTWLREALVARSDAVSVSTLSQWRSGARLPEGERSLAVVANLETVLGVPTNSLTSLIGSSRRTGRLSEAAFPWDDEALNAAVGELLGRLDTDFPPHMRELSTQTVADVGAHGGVTVRRTRSILQATTEVVTSLPVFEVMPWTAIPQPTFRGVSGGTVSQMEAHASGRVFGAVVELEQPLIPGASTVLETEVEFSPDGPLVQETGHGVARSIRDILIWVRFQGKLPDWCNLVEDLPGKAPTVRPIPIDKGGSMHVSRAPFGPGSLGMHWGSDISAEETPFSRPS